MMSAEYEEEMAKFRVNFVKENLTNRMLKVLDDLQNRYKVKPKRVTGRKEINRGTKRT